MMRNGLSFVYTRNGHKYNAIGRFDHEYEIKRDLTGHNMSLAKLPAAEWILTVDGTPRISSNSATFLKNHANELNRNATA